MADDQASSVPPFIPGLLIVSLLIIISLLIGWRNYMRRGSPQTPITLAEWNLNWLQDGREVTSTIQRPKIWEVVVDDKSGRRGSHGIQSWEKAMPLSVISVDPDLILSHETDKKDYTTRALPSPSWLPRLGYFPPLSRPASKQSKHQPITTLSTRAHDFLQVSLIITMPTPNNTSSSHRQVGIQALSSIDLARSEPERDHSNERVTSVFNNENDEDKGAPEVAFGVIALPLEKGLLQELNAHKDEISDD